MTRGRKPTTVETVEKPEIDTEAVEAVLQEGAQLAALTQRYSQGRDLVNQLLGQAQAFQAAGDLLRTFGVSKLAIVKENKLYQQLAGVVTPNGSELTGTWAEFCGLLGISDDKANQDIANLRAFGEEALEQMQRIGIGYRELRQYRKLPDDQKLALIEVAKTGDKESFVELAEEIIAKHAKEKEALQQEIAEVKEAAADKDRVIAQKSNKIEELVEDKNRRERMTDAEKFAEMERLLTEATLVSIGDMQVIRRHIQDIRSEDKTPHGVYMACANALQRVVSEAMGIAADWGIALTLAADPDDETFDDPNADEDLDDELNPQAV